MALPTLRDYQQHDLEQVRLRLREYRSVLLVQPTGAGKGTLASFIVRSASSRGHRVLFLVNRRTLVHDMSQRIGKLGLDHGVIMGDDPRFNLEHPVQVASIDTLQRREHVPPADLLIIDEAHFAVSAIWKEVVDRYPAAKSLGMTATPIRSDGRGLGEMFDVMVQGPIVQSLIEGGYLVPAVVFRPANIPNLRGVRKLAGDFNQKQLAEVCDKPKMIGDAYEQWRKHATDRKTAAFGINQHHAIQLAERFRCEGVSFAYVDCDTSDSERERIWRDFDHGTLRGVASVGVISYGWDHPICSCIVGARPTASIGLWRQILGRASRPYPGKENFIVLDHFNNTERLSTFFEDPVEWSLEGSAIKQSKDQAPSITTCRQCFATFRTGPQRCPYCSVELEKKPPQKVEEVAGELEQIQRSKKALAIAEWRQRVQGDDRRKQFEEYQRIAKERNYKPNWPALRFKIIFGKWPPREWSKGA